MTSPANPHGGALWRPTGSTPAGAAVEAEGRLEAAACGLPVITTRVGNMPELIRDGENGFFVERDVADIAEKLGRLRDDLGLRDRLGRAARSAIESWDWRWQAARYDAMLREILGERQIAKIRAL